MAADLPMRPLAGVRVVEMAGLGPAPFAATVLIGMGAEVIRIDPPRPSAPLPLPSNAQDVTGDDRTVEVLDLHTAGGRAAALQLIAAADVLIEGFRPGVMERLGLSPQACHEVNPGLLYGRVTGWGQYGPLAARAGHDINYLALSGALSLIGPAGGRPVPPVNLVADFGGGAMFLVAGILAGLVARASTGSGCVVDAAMVDGVGALMATVWGLRNAGQWTDERGANLLDGGAPFYDTYECEDGRWVAVGSLEPRFFAVLRDGMREFAEVSAWPDQYDRDRWPDLRLRLAEAFRLRSRDFWADRFAATDACVTAVLTPDEARQHPHQGARHAYQVSADGLVRPAPAPRIQSVGRPDFDRDGGGER